MGQFNVLKTAVIGTMILGLAACGTQQGAEDANRNRVETNGIRSYATNQVEHMTKQNYNRPFVDYQTDNRVNFDVHKNRRVDLSEAIAETLTEMKEIKTANVLLTDRNAYIGVVLDEDEDQGSGSPRGINNVENQNHNDRANNDRFFARENTTYDRNNEGNDPILTGRNNAFTNRTNNQESNDVSLQLKNKIVSKVKKVNRNVQNVYVSANPNFNDRMEGFMAKVRAGDPVDGLVEEFNTMVRRIFPMNMTGMDRGLQRSGQTVNNTGTHRNNTERSR